MTRYKPVLCACGRPVTAGWTLPSQATRHARCLICETARVMQTFVYPAKRRKEPRDA